MENDEFDLYDIALGKEYCPNETASTSKTALETENKATSPAPVAEGASVSVELFRNLLMGSRSQVEKLKLQNNILKTNLKNAIASSSVVTCPHCTHCFKDRHCSMKPRSMRKMRARNCVELEFETLEELEAWLYLNQLETNNDGMPTLMDIKKPISQENSLKSVGSLLPALVEKEKERQEKRSENIRLKILEKSEKKIRKEENSSKIDVKIDQKFTKERGSDHREKRNETRKENIESVITSRRLNRYRKSESPEEARRVRVRGDDERHRRRYADEEISSIRRDTKEGSKKTEDNKRKLPPAKENIIEPKMAKKSISERIQYPSSINKSSGVENVFPTTSNQQKSSEMSSKMDNPDTPSAGKITSNQTVKPKRAPIVWDDDHKSCSSKEQESELKVPGPSTRKAFEFKLKTVDKKQGASKTEIVSKSVCPAPTKEPSTKYKFVPTSKKNSVGNSEPASKNTPSACAPDFEKDKKSTTELILKDEGSSTETRTLQQKEESWIVYSVKKSANVLDHIYKRALERQAFQRKWSQTTIIFDEIKQTSFGLLTEGISVLQKQADSNLKTATNTQQVVSTPSAPQSSIVTEIDDGSDMLNEFFPDLACRSNQQINGATPTTTDFSYRPLSTESFSSMVDREEEELAHLIREDSVVPPSNDCLLDMELEGAEETIVSQETTNQSRNSRREESDANEDWDEFCLEDVDDDVDETTRDRKLSEMSKTGEIEQNMDWDVDGEEPDESNDDPESQTQTIPESESIEEEVEVDDEQTPKSHRTESVPLKMNTDFRLSDDEDLISPITSTPRPRTAKNDMEEPLEDIEEHEPIMKPRDDSYVDELDWDYGTDEGEEDDQCDQHEGNITVIEMAGVGGTDDTDSVVQNDLLEDGEISDEELKEEKKETVKEKPKRERITFSPNENKVMPEREVLLYFKMEIQDKKEPDEKERRRERDSRRSDDRRRHHSPRRRSQENRKRNHQRDYQPASYKHLLKRRNT
ncbi:hypothetical protein CAEBREN_26276 [Caenorhabditis brenneri]|uniref:Uncharacterized protein n=1 Tax=Caenorhabditis brenneri TaxID=135651 RepID=G0PHQ5_CAEBE|nr:hypothetical protein CAEBREN_26276 [Caenorhabditis brenneri]